MDLTRTDARQDYPVAGNNCGSTSCMQAVAKRRGKGGKGGGGGGVTCAAPSCGRSNQDSFRLANLIFEFYFLFSERIDWRLEALHHPPPGRQHGDHSGGRPPSRLPHPGLANLVVPMWFVEMQFTPFCFVSGSFLNTHTHTLAPPPPYSHFSTTDGSVLEAGSAGAGAARAGGRSPGTRRRGDRPGRPQRLLRLFP